MQHPALENHGDDEADASEEVIEQVGRVHVGDHSSLLKRSVEWIQL